ncbi:NAD(P)-binding protein [Patellaria atrata CBS 101060]|uniref:NAD(P)-binding protein n=1 Tax=Patellaria atrata CBS 101060 TaxID=1346257 RepID=A0A9P4SCL6_9PEZI|nr:NAD(P)-binding protein [Patellaria atrata CBS 101060]
MAPWPLDSVITFCSRFFNQSFFIAEPTLTEKNLPDQFGRVFIITGGYTGVGYQLCKILYQRNGTVYIAGRSESKGRNAIDSIKKDLPDSKGRIEFLLLDLADHATIKESAENFLRREERLDVLTNNAGVMFPPLGTKDAQGNEIQMGTNCLGHFIFTHNLLPILLKTAAKSRPGSVRVTWAASIGVDVYAPYVGINLVNGEWKPYRWDNKKNYAVSKAGNIFYATEVARRFGKQGLVSVAFNPGNLRTELQRYSGWSESLTLDWLLYPAVLGAYTELYAGWSEDITSSNNGAYVVPWGRLYDPKFGVIKSTRTKEQGGTGIAKQFWDWSENFTKHFL